MTIEDVAKVCHDTNRAYCKAIGDDSQPTWENAPEWQQNSLIQGVKFHYYGGGDFQPEASHRNWLLEKRAEGWRYGLVKDVEKKEHPCFCEYEELPENQKVKDFLFTAVAKTLLPYVI